MQFANAVSHVNSAAYHQEQCLDDVHTILRVVEGGYEIAEQLARVALSLDLGGSQGEASSGKCVAYQRFAARLGHNARMSQIDRIEAYAWKLTKSTGNPMHCVVVLHPFNS